MAKCDDCRYQVPPEGWVRKKTPFYCIHKACERVSCAACAGFQSNYTKLIAKLRATEKKIVIPRLEAALRKAERRIAELEEALATERRKCEVLAEALADASMNDAQWLELAYDKAKEVEG